jgi:hypothetical protein
LAQKYDVGTGSGWPSAQKDIWHRASAVTASQIRWHKILFYSTHPMDRYRLFGFGKNKKMIQKFSFGMADVGITPRVPDIGLPPLVQQGAHEDCHNPRWVHTSVTTEKTYKRMDFDK